MLTIRNEQMRALEAARVTSFERRLLAEIRDRWPDLEARGVELAEQVHVGIERGLRHFTTEHDVARYVRIVLEQLGGWTAVDHPQAALEMLHGPALPPRRRLDNFERWVHSHRAAHA
jgi:hypothetical protein